MRQTVYLVKADNRSITLRIYEGKRSKSIRVGGWWKVDSGNKLKFYLSQKQDFLGNRKSVVFYGSWWVDRDNYLVYELKSPKGLKRIVLKGEFLRFSDRSFVYRLEKTDTVLKLKGKVRGRFLLKGDVIRYDVSVEGRRYSSGSVVSVAGRWVSKKGSVGFLVKYKKRFVLASLRFSKRINRHISLFVEARRSAKGDSVMVGIRGRF